MSGDQDSKSGASADRDDTAPEVIIAQEADRESPNKLEDEPPGGSPSNDRPPEVVGFLRGLLREGAVFFRVLDRYDDRFSIRTGKPSIFWTALVLALLLDALYFLVVCGLMLAAIALVVFTLARGTGLFGT